MSGKRNGGRLPPHGMSLKELQSDSPPVLKLGLGRELLVVPERDDARPMLGREFVNLETDKGIVPHPVDFLTLRGKAIEKLVVEIDMDGNDVRLIIVSARQTSDARPGEHGAALLRRHLVNDHGKPHTYITIFAPLA